MVSAILEVNYHLQIDKLGGSFIHDFVQGRIDMKLFLCFDPSISLNAIKPVGCCTENRPIHCSMMYQCEIYTSDDRCDRKQWTFAQFFFQLWILTW